jgi:hypothetical protein
MTGAQNLGSMLLFGGSITSIAVSLDIAQGEGDPVLLLWGVLLGVVPLLTLGSRFRVAQAE